MNEERYLYGAAVQGIQSFIFQTNKLKEIVGASELVERICTDAFKKFEGEGESIVRAAGNIKYLFYSADKCQRAVLNFPKEVMEMAPGITISQAVVKLEGEYACFENAVNELERRLRIQRNKPVRPTTLGLIGIKRSPATGLPLLVLDKKYEFLKEKENTIDAATKAKLIILDNFEKDNTQQIDVTFKLSNKSFGLKHISKKLIAYRIDEMTSQNDWIAIIHADGNGLGQILQKIGKEPATLKQFSKRLDETTQWSARYAFGKMLQYGKFGKPKTSNNEALDLSINLSDNFIKNTKTIHEFINNYEITEYIPIRPVVLSGDDLTLICRADIAIDYTEAFMDAFEKLTQLHLGNILYHTDGKDTFQVFVNDKEKKPVNYLTACAGISFIKSSFPFHYGYTLAEELCGVAKKDAKLKKHRIGKSTDNEEDMLPTSCLLFHKVQDSFADKYEQLVDRELSPQNDISFKFGPYYLRNEPIQRWSIHTLKENTKEFRKEESKTIKSHLRQWLSLLSENIEVAQQKINRLEKITASKNTREFIHKITDLKIDGRTPIYDMFVLDTILNQITNNKQ